MEAMKINKLEIENIKRVKAVRIEPTANGLTVIGGNNNQGKTSVLDSIAWALGGERYRPSEAQFRESAVPPYLHIVMNNGLVVERKGKNSSLKITDSTGRKGGQQILNEFVEQLAIDLPKFMEASRQEKAKTLLKIIGIGDRLEQLDKKEKELASQRTAVGRIADQKEKYAKEMVYYPEAPNELVSPTELILQQQEILARNGENQKKRERESQRRQQAVSLAKEVESIRERLLKKEKELEEANALLNAAIKEASELHDEPTAELEQSILNIEETNRKVRANLDKDKAEEDARAYREQYDGLTVEINQARKDRDGLLQSVELPLPGLSVADGELIYGGQKWDNMSGSDRLKVATAIVRKLNPKCGFVLLDKLEQMDVNTLNEFGKWLEREGLQAIATRVSTGDECSIIIEDGYVAGREQQAPENKNAKWKAGEF